jgi:spore coat polysaccharide biosynthesis protein SpsF
MLISPTIYNPPSFPEGLDIEVFSFEALSRAARDSIDPFEREHVTQFFYRNPQRFTQINVTNHQNISHLRWTIDTQQDLDMAREVYSRLYRDGEIFVMKDILGLLAEHPYIAEMNADVKRSDMYSSKS